MNVYPTGAPGDTDKIYGQDPEVAQELSQTG